MGLIKTPLKIIFRDDLARDALIMFLGTSLTNFFNLIYTIFLMRNLTPADFGLFNSLLALVMIFSQLPSAFSMTINRFVSRYHAWENFYIIKKIIFTLGKKISMLGLFIGLTIFLMHKPLGNFLKISDGSNFFLFSFIILFSYISSVPQAALQGLQKFLQLSFTSVISGGLKLIFVILLIELGMGVSGALGAFLLSTVCGFLMGSYFLYKSLPSFKLTSGHENVDFKEIYRYFIPVFVVTLVSVSFLNMDVVLVKKLFNPIQAGYYSISQVVGKIVFFFPSALIMVMFPKVANTQARNRDTKFLLKKSIFYMAILSISVASIAIIFPGLTLKVLAGKVYPACYPLVRVFAVNMVLLSVIFVFLNYYLSLNARKILYVFLGGVVLEVALISLFHKSLLQVLGIIFVCFSALLLFNFWVAFKNPRVFQTE